MISNLNIHTSYFYFLPLVLDNTPTCFVISIWLILLSSTVKNHTLVAIDNFIRNKDR